MAQGSVRQRGSTWTVVFDEPRPDGRRRQRSKGGFRTRKDAERYLREQLVSLDAGTYMAPHKLTVATYLTEHWLPAMQARGLRPSTLERYESHVRCAITPALGGLPLQRLMPTHLNKLYGDLRASGRAPKTIRNIHGVLSKALADAERWGLVGRNAARLADVPAVARPKLRVWSPEQTRAFLSAVANDRLFAAWLLAATTGMRRWAFAGRTSTWTAASCASPRRGYGPGTRWWLASRRRLVAGAPSHSTRPPWRRCVSTASARLKSGWPRARTMRTAAWSSPCRAARPSIRTVSACGFGGTSGRLGCRPSGCTTCVTPTPPPGWLQGCPPSS
jgi:Arm DNA-binding domain/Phage integrase, N-terminal SAM-like domain